ncbi:TetR/AcrR family transcriptional regulator [Paenisporosarcina quisquiliarum]|uniref:TetR/AcrR family transcriptional regulator n=1 Tax=Paenisporosarcina quisquiliarum TaxID=365346 RepID=A0A9X3LKP1_9BACL|nr:TetR/AcrR family transcriptional regulator [Paenisporosarcina quisquiliarum]MCZ8538329.1 TetR/AcrR family transcriptional regulator [Paenisporosarcina quisquiliarum]
MTAEQIKEIALKYFAQNGYEGTSLANIANDVGIKKQSIYTHFKSKDELFLLLCNETYENELEFVLDFIEKKQDSHIKEFLYDFLIESKVRYEKHDSARFWLRTAFYPPSHLNSQVMQKVYEYLDKLEDYLLPIIDEAIKKGEISSAIEKERVTAAFLGVLDGIFVEMLYGGPIRLEKRLDASWYLFWLGLSIK